jgi:hypothetical protein
MLSHMVAHAMHISAHIAHIFPHMGDMRIMPLADIWHISMQSMNMHIIFMSILPLLMHCIMVSMHMVMQLRQSSIHRRISADISIFSSPELGFGLCQTAVVDLPESTKHGLQESRTRANLLIGQNAQSGNAVACGAINPRDFTIFVRCWRVNTRAFPCWRRQLPEELVRISVGIEAEGDRIDDLDRAFPIGEAARHGCRYGQSTLNPCSALDFAS